ncbi:MAG: hypothetical protein LBG80_19065 [Bacteroidales bacterium]|jgi:hypothetical protein|nr:hypothetical protein [Bacteroidales bacterium]
MVTAIIAIIAVAISIATTATTQGMSARARKKDYLWTILRTPVYEQGLSLESVKLMYLSEYRANPDLFKRYYDEYISIRNADMATGAHPSSKKKRFYCTRSTLSLVY